MQNRRLLVTFSSYCGSSSTGNGTEMCPNVSKPVFRAPINDSQDLTYTYRTRSMPSRASSELTVSRVQTASLPIQTPWSLAPISAPHIQAGLLRITAWVCSSCGIWMYVHCKQKSVSKSEECAMLTEYKLDETDGNGVSYQNLCTLKVYVYV